MTLRYATLRYTTPRYTTPHYTTPHYTTPHYTQLHYTTLPYPTLHCIALHYITIHSLHHHKCNCNYTTPITLHHNYNSATLQLQLHYTTLHPAAHYIQQLRVRWPTRWPLQPLQPFQKNTAPTTFRSISGFALPSVIHNPNLSYRFPIFETSATALCGTTGIILYYPYGPLWISFFSFLIVLQWMGCVQ